MNVSLKWLGTLVDIKGLDPEEMAETLTIDGIPVERVIYPGKGISGLLPERFYRSKSILTRISWLFAMWMLADQIPFKL